MPRIVAFEDVKHTRSKNNGSFSTKFLKSSRDTPNLPVAQLSEGDPGRTRNTHFHTVDEFQVIVGGKGTIGRHNVSACSVHFARAYTSYGPIVGDETTGLSYFVLFARFDPGPQYFPQAREVLKQAPNRPRSQVTKNIAFPDLIPGVSVKLEDIDGFKDDEGLAAYSLIMAPYTRIMSPDPSSGDGQFMVIVKGGLIYEKREYKALTVVFVKPDEAPFQIAAGPQGLQSLILNSPRQNLYAIAGAGE
jgi:hypothetical protein